MAASHASHDRGNEASGRIRIAPCTVKAATKKVREWHRHLPDIQGGLFAAQAVDVDGVCLGVAIAGNPARVWQDQAKLVIARVATTGAENACSALYGSLCRAAKALGYLEVWTYTLPHEPGTSLRAAGFIDMGMTAGGEHDRPSRARRPAVNAAPKRRWLRRLSGNVTVPTPYMGAPCAFGPGVRNDKETLSPETRLVTSVGNPHLGCHHDHRETHRQAVLRAPALSSKDGTGGAA